MAVAFDFGSKRGQFEALVLGHGFGAENAGYYDFVSQGKAVREIGLEHAAAKCVGTRLEDGPETRSRIASAEGFQSTGNCCWMMREVIDDGDAVDLGFHFKATLHALESFERGGDGVFANSAGGSESRGSGGVPDVVFAGKGKFEIGPRLVVVKNGPGGAPRGKAKICNSPIRARACAVAIDRTERLAQAALETCAFGGAVERD